MDSLAISSSTPKQDTTGVDNAAIAAAALTALLAVIAMISQTTGSDHPGSNDPLQSAYGDKTMSHAAPTASAGEYKGS